MFCRKIKTLFIFLILSVLNFAPVAQAAIPMQINYQGSVEVSGTPFTGTGLFRFAIVDPDTGFNVWTNDGTQIGTTNMPTAPVSVAVEEGVYSLNLGDATLANMVVIPGGVFDDDNAALRIWFDDGTNGVEQLVPDDPITSAPYAFHALDADTVGGVQAADLQVFSTAGIVTSNSPGALATDDFVFGSDQLADDGDANHDSRFFFDKSKGAFRAGTATGTEWDDANVGMKSTAMGDKTLASGNYSLASGFQSKATATGSTAMGGFTLASGSFSTAMGNTTTASGYRSTAMGAGTTASGDYSTAMGSVTIASGYESTAMGVLTSASGVASTAMGRGTTASGYESTAMGRDTIASGNYSTAMGRLTSASGSYSTAMGRDTIASGNYSTAIGRLTSASGNNSTAMGRGTKATATGSTAMGDKTLASGYDSTAMGDSTTASGNNSTAMGGSTLASGSFSTAMGKITKATATGSTAMGGYTLASGRFSTAMGFLTNASGIESTAMGRETIASGDYSTAIGRGIEAGGNYSVAIALNNQAGTTVSDQNTMAIMGGEVGIGTVSPSHILHVNGVARSTQATWDTSSDKRVKTEVTELDGSLDRLLQLRPVKFEWTEEFRKANPGISKEDISFLAQEVEKIFPQMVRQVQEQIGDVTIDDFRVMNSSILIPLLVKAMQEQQEVMEHQDTLVTQVTEKMATMEEEIALLRAMLEEK